MHGFEHHPGNQGDPLDEFSESGARQNIVFNTMWGEDFRRELGVVRNIPQRTRLSRRWLTHASYPGRRI